MELNRLMVVVAVALICGCQYSHVNHHENAGVHPITDIFDFRKEMRLAYIEMCKQEAQSVNKPLCPRWLSGRSRSPMRTRCAARGSRFRSSRRVPSSTSRRATPKTGPASGRS